MSYTHTDNVVYAQSPADPTKAYVTSSPAATGAITILKEVTINTLTYPVTSIGAGAFNGNTLTSVTFPSDSLITTIGNNAFKNSGLSTINIPDSVITIGDYAFTLNKLETLSGGKNLTTIGQYAFSSNKLSSITIPNKVTEIANSAFETNALNNLLFLGSDVVTIGDSAFQGNQLTQLFIPVSVTSLGNSAFRNNSLLAVYLFNNQTVTTFGPNCFFGNDVNISAYYLEGFDTTSLSSIFETRIYSQSLVQLLTPLVAQPGVSIETLVNDGYTFEVLSKASAAVSADYRYMTARNLFGYFDNISSPVPLSSYLTYSNDSTEYVLFTVSQLKQAKDSLQITDFKDLGANIQQVFDAFSLPAMIVAGYLVADIVAGVTTVPNTTTPPTITDFYNANANVQQMLYVFGLQSMWDSNYYSFNTLVALKVKNSDVTITVAQWWALSSFFNHRIKPTVQQLYEYYGKEVLLRQLHMLEPETAVATLYDGINLSTEPNTVTRLSVSQLWSVKPETLTVQQMASRYNLQDLWNGIYEVEPTTAVSTIRTGLTTSPTVAQWWALTPKPTVQQLYNGGYTALQDLWTGINDVATIRVLINISANDWVYNFWSLTSGKPSVQQLYDGGFNLDKIWDGLRRAGEPTGVATIYDGINLSTQPNTVTKPTVSQFWNLRPTHPSVQQLTSKYDLQDLWNGIQNVQNIYDGIDTKPSVSDFENLTNPPSISQLYRSSGGYNLAALLEEHSLTEILDQVANLTISDFKSAGAPIQQVYNKYGLSEMIGAGYLVDDIVAGVTTVPNTTTPPTIAAFKAASAPIQEVYNHFRLTAMIGADYYVKDIIPLDNTLGYNSFTAVSGIPAWNLMTYYLFSEHSADLLSRFTVSVIKDASALDYVASGNQGLTASDFKTANASIVQMLNEFTLAELIHLYTTEQLVIASQDAGVTNVLGNQNLTIAQMKDAGDELWQVMNYYGEYGNGLDDLLTVDYYVDDLVTASNLKDDSNNYLVTVTALQNLGNKLSSFVTANNTLGKSKLWNLVRYFDLSALLPSYTVSELNATASNTNVPVDKRPNVSKFKAADTNNSYIQNIYDVFKTSTYGNYRLSAMISAGYLVDDIVAGVTAVPVLTITDFKSAGAPIQQVYDQFGLPAMIGAGYLVAEIVAGVTTVPNTITPPTIAAFKTAGAPIQEVYDQFRLPAMIVAGYLVADIVAGVTTVPNTITPPTIAAFKTALAPIQQVYDQFKTSTYGNYRLSAMIGAGYLVADIVAGVTADPVLTITDFKSAGAPIQEVYNQFGLTAMIGAGYLVADIVAGVTTVPNTTTPPTIANFKAASAPIQQVYNQFKTSGEYRLSAMIGALYTVSEIVAGVTADPALTIADFKTASAPIQQVYSQYELSVMIGANYYVSDIIAVDNTLEYSDFTAVTGIPAWNLMTYYLFSEHSADLLSRFTVSVIKDASALDYVASGNQGLTASDFKTANASIVQMLNKFTLAELIHLYTTEQLVLASQDAGVTNVLGNKNLTIAQIKEAGDELYQVMNYYGTYGAGLADLLQVDYTVDDLITTSNLKDGSDNYLVTVSSLQNLILSSFVTANNALGKSKLWSLINYFVLSDLLTPYSVDELNETTNDTKVNSNKTVNITSLKAANAPVGDMLTEFGLQAMWDAGYTVSELKSVGVTIDQLWALSSDTIIHLAKPTIQQLYAENGTQNYGLQGLWTYFVDVAQIYEGLDVKPTVEQFWALTSGKPTIQQLKSSTKYGLQELWDYFGDVAQIYNGLDVKPTVREFDELNSITRSKPTIQQLKSSTKYGLQEIYDYFRLREMIVALYTVSEIVAGVTTVPNTTTPPTIADFKTALAPIQQVYDKYGLSVMINMATDPYTISEIVAGVTTVPNTTTPPTIADFKTANTPIQKVFDYFRLSAMIGAGYLVADIVAGVTTVPDTITPPTIADFKAASAPIQEVYNQFRLTAMIGANYYVKDIIPLDNTLGYNSFTAVSGIPAWNLMTYYLFSEHSADLLSRFTVSVIKDDSADSRVALQNKNFTASDFKAVNASIVQMLNAFTLVELILLYTTEQLVVASQNAGVTVVGNKNLTISQIKQAGDELWQVMNYYGTYGAGLVDLLTVDYPVADLVTASNLKDGSNNYLVTVTSLQNLGNNLSSFVTANNTNTLGKSKLWNLINYFELSDLLSSYSVDELNATTDDTKVNSNKTVNITSLKAANAPVGDMLTEFGLQAMWDAGYTVSELKSVGVTIDQLWALSSDTIIHLAKPTIQQLYAGGYTLQDLWNCVSVVAQIHDGLTVNPTVAQFWALTGGKPTVQQLKSSTKYGLQELWTGINNVSTIRTGLTPAPTAADFKTEVTTNPPTVKQLYEGGYSLTNLIDALYTVAQIRNITTGIGVVTNGRQTFPTLADFKAANAPLWQLLNASYYNNILDAGGNTGFDSIDFIKAGYTVTQLVTASQLKDGSNNYLVTVENNQNMNIYWFYPGQWDTNNLPTGFTEEEKNNLLCDVLSYFEPGACINTYAGSAATSYYAVPKLIEASNAKNNDDTYKVTLVDNQQLNTKLSRFINGDNKVYTWELYKLLRYRSVFTTFSIFDLEGAYGISNIISANSNRDTTSNTWDASHPDWRVTIAELKSSNVPIANMINYYGGSDLQLLLTVGYTISELRIASIPTSLNNRITVAKFLALDPPKTIRQLQNGGYNLQELLQGVAPNNNDSISPLLIATSGYSPVPTIAVFMALESPPTTQQLYQAFGLQQMYDAIVAEVDVNRINLSSVVNNVSPSPTVAQWWALTRKPTLQQLSTVYDLQKIWTGINDVATIKTGLNTTVAQFWSLTDGKPTVQQLSTGGYSLQEIWTGINAVATIKTGLSTTVAQFWSLTDGKPTVQQLSTGGYSLQDLWTGIYAVEPTTAVSTIRTGLTSRPTVAQFWALTNGKPTVQQLYDGGYTALQDLWDGINNVSTIKTGLTITPIVAQWRALSSDITIHVAKPTVQQLYDAGYIVAEMISGGFPVSEILSSVSSNNNTSADDIIADLKDVGYKIIIPAPRITAASFLTGVVTLTVNQASPDIPITQYWYSHTSNGGVTWSDYAVIMDSVNPGQPMLPNGSGNLLISGFSAGNKLHSFRIKADASDVISNTSNTYKNLFF